MSTCREGRERGCWGPSSRCRGGCAPSDEPEVVVATAARGLRWRGSTPDARDSPLSPHKHEVCSVHEQLTREGGVCAEAVGRTWAVYLQLLAPLRQRAQSPVFTASTAQTRHTGHGPATVRGRVQRELRARHVPVLQLTSGGATAEAEPPLLPPPIDAGSGQVKGAEAGGPPNPPPIADVSQGWWERQGWRRQRVRSCLRCADARAVQRPSDGARGRVGG